MKIGSLQSGFRASTFATTTKAISRALERLSTGERFSSPKDDPASYSQSVNLESQTRGLRQLAQNASQEAKQNESSQSSLEAQLDLVQRMREIAVQATGTTLSAAERENLTTELKSLLSEYQRLSKDAPEEASSELTEVIGTGTFDANQSHSGLLLRQRLITKDINNDGYNDVISWTQTRGIWVMLSQGEGHYGPETKVYDVALGNLGGVNVLDMDGDHIDDIAFTDTNPYYLKGSGDGTFQAIQTLSTSITASDAAFADFNNDGFGDLVYTGGLAQVQLALNDRAGQLGTSQGTSVLADASLPIETADLNNDGRMDIFFQSDAVANYSVFVGLNDGQNDFASSEYFSTSASVGFGVQAGDFDGDGYLDLIYADNLFPTVLMNQRDGQFVNSAILGLPTNSKSYHTGDVNGDGYDDLVSGAANIWLSDGKGTFQLTGSVTHPNLNSALGGNFALSDMNNDGVLDFVHGQIGIGIALGRAKEIGAGARATDISDPDKAQNLIDILDRAIEGIKLKQGSLEAVHSKLDSQIASQLLLAESLEEANLKLKALDYAVEVAELTRLQTLQQAQTAVAAQANVNLSLVLKLLG